MSTQPQKSTSQGRSGYTSGNIQPLVENYSRLMTERLQEKASQYPQGWTSEQPQNLFNRLDANVNKLETLIAGGHPDTQQVRQLVADIGAFGAMICDNVGGFGKSTGS